MAEREFTITELRRAGDGGFIDTPVKFVWTNENRAAPRGSWKFGLVQRTVREDYPGVEEPVEQVLGPNYTDFTLQGVWDDRYNFPGFALDTQRKFEELVQRGTLCRFDFETISIVGLPKAADFDYRRAALISYSFTVSPHYRKTGGISTGSTVRRKAPAAFRPPSEYRDISISTLESMDSVQLDAPEQLSKGGLMHDIKATINTLRTNVGSLTSVVDTRLGALQGDFTDLKRAANALNVIKGTCAGTISSLASVKSATQLAYDNAVGILDFDVWRTSLTALSRRLALTSHNGQDELSQRAEPKAVALYRPAAGESLYSISQRFYGTPTQWQTIATTNGLTTMVLKGTEVLIIPAQR